MMPGACAPRASRPAGCGSGPGSACRTPGFDDLDSYGAIVEHYRHEFLPEVEAEAAFYGDRTQTPAGAIKRACLSLLEGGGLHDHQHRIGYQGMAAAANFIEPHADALIAAADFAELHFRVAALAAELPRIGELAIYDIAQRIGWYRGIEPAEVYLHCGALEGAKALVPQLRGKTVSVAQLPLALHALTPAQLEDVLCLYKAVLKRLAAGDRRGS
ncbi:MAG: hypothetical protein QOG72_2167 [Sphingomonadales bacterium]|jgi:hypothetical protein|nr:hypothetical protein [Sphingomonadales bacterium]